MKLNKIATLHFEQTSLTQKPRNGRPFFHQIRSLACTSQAVTFGPRRPISNVSALISSLLITISVLVRCYRDLRLHLQSKDANHSIIPCLTQSLYMGHNTNPCAGKKIDEFLAPLLSATLCNPSAQSNPITAYFLISSCCLDSIGTFI